MAGIEIQDSELTELLQSLGLAFSQSALETKIGPEIALMFQTRIKQRTQEGVDVNENPFISYTLDYEAFREKTGRQTENVDLNFSGTMLASMTSDVKGGEVRIFFADTQQALKALGNMTGPNPRSFFAFSDSDIQEAERLASEYMRRALA